MFLKEITTFSCLFCDHLIGNGGFEPCTSLFETKRTTSWATSPVALHFHISSFTIELSKNLSLKYCVCHMIRILSIYFEMKCPFHGKDLAFTNLNTNAKWDQVSVVYFPGWVQRTLPCWGSTSLKKKKYKTKLKIKNKKNVCQVPCSSIGTS